MKKPATWNYRLIRDDEGYLGFHEVYYDKDGHILGCTENQVSLWAETTEGLRKQFEDAVSKPILTHTGDKLVPEKVVN